MIFYGFMLHSNPISLKVNKKSNYRKTLHYEFLKRETTLNYLDIATMQIFCTH